jgi:peptide/nickel transport system permease protein
MVEYLIRRVLLTVPVVFLVSILVFMSINMMPGDALIARVSEGVFPTPEELAVMRETLGLDQPVHVRYLKWLWNALQGDFGDSLYNREPALQEYLRAFPVTLQIAIMAMVLTQVIAVGVGVVSAVWADSWIDYLARMFALAGLSIPNFVIATVIVIAPSIWWGYAAPPGYTHFWDDPIRNLQQVGPAVLSLSLAGSALTMRMTRSTVLEALRSDYIRTARSKGLKESRVVLRHGLRNAMLPVLTIQGQVLAALLGGTVVVEQIFALPGVGRLTLDAINHRDYIQLEANVLFFAIIYQATVLVVDVLYGVVDPRVRV